MAKLATKFAAPKVKKQIFASRDAELQALCGGKTVYEIAVAMDLDEDGLDIILGQNDVFSLLLVKPDGTEIIIPMSSALIAEFTKEGADGEDIMKWQFRVTDAPVWETIVKDGNKTKVKKLDAEGKEVKAPFLNIGLPGGEFSYTRNNVLAEEEVEGKK